MKLIVGLGNPGGRFVGTRHNVGFIVLDELTRMVDGQWLMDNKFKSLIIKHKSFVSAKPQTFMNESGKAVSAISQYLNILISNIYIVHDDLDIKLGEYKIQFGKGPKNHKGLNSIYEKLGTKDFWHVRIGVENRDQTSDVGHRTSGEEYVLQKFSEDELEILNKVIKKAAKELKEKIYE